VPDGPDSGKKESMIGAVAKSGMFKTPEMLVEPFHKLSFVPPYRYPPDAI
jgi:hypothetical protein